MNKLPENQFKFLGRCSNFKVQTTFVLKVHYLPIAKRGEKGEVAGACFDWPVCSGIARKASARLLKIAVGAF